MEKIDKFRGEYYFLSNFYKCKIFMYGFIYNNAEAAFQAMKCDNIEGRKCQGFKENSKLFWPNIDIDFEQGSIISYRTFDEKGLEAAIKEADNK